MLRLTIPTLSLLLALPLAAQAASKQEYELNQMLQKVAKESSVGTPRAINEDILDQGYTVEKGRALVNHLSVRESHAERMRANPEQVRSQLGDSVCRNNGYRQLMSKGAVRSIGFRSTRPTSRSWTKPSTPPAAWRVTRRSNSGNPVVVTGAPLFFIGAQLRQQSLEITRVPLCDFQPAQALGFQAHLMGLGSPLQQQI